MSMSSRRSPWLAAVWQVALVASVLLAAVLAAPQPQPLLIPPRGGDSSLYAFSSTRAPSSSLTTFRYYFQKQNLDWLEQQFTAISDPKHPSYRKFLNKSVIDDKVLPNKSVTAPVYAYFQSNGIPLSNLTQKEAILYVTAPVSVVERMFGISLYVYPRKGASSTTGLGSGRSGANSTRSVGAAILRSPDSLTVPAALTPPLWFILGLNDLPPKVAGKNFTKLSRAIKAPSTH